MTLYVLSFHITVVAESGDLIVFNANTMICLEVFILGDALTVNSWEWEGHWNLIRIFVVYCNSNSYKGFLKKARKVD